MDIRTAILAACTGTLLLTSTLALAGEPIPGVDVKLGKTCPPVCGKPKATGTVLSGTGVNGTGAPENRSANARRGSAISENESPRPGNRKSQQLTPGSDAGRSQIFDRWGKSKI